jgi:hypothetical protein
MCQKLNLKEKEKKNLTDEEFKEILKCEWDAAEKEEEEWEKEKFTNHRFAYKY